MNKRTILLAAVLLVTVPLLSACQGTVFGLRGSGTVATEIREASGFSGVLLLGSGRVRIELTGTESVEIEAEDNLLEHLTTDVVDGVLELSSSRSISPTEEIVYTINASMLERVSISGSGDVEATGVRGERFAADISGSGSIGVFDIDVEAVTAAISGSGEVDIGGATDSLEVSINGSGGFDGVDLIAIRGRVVVSGSGNAAVNVIDQLDAEISGSGNITYVGDPTVNSVTSGSGSIGPG